MTYCCIKLIRDVSRFDFFGAQNSCHSGNLLVSGTVESGFYYRRYKCLRRVFFSTDILPASATLGLLSQYSQGDNMESIRLKYANSFKPAREQELFYRNASNGITMRVSTTSALRPLKTASPCNKKEPHALVPPSLELVLNSITLSNHSSACSLLYHHNCLRLQLSKSHRLHIPVLHRKQDPNDSTSRVKDI